jgi:hypothetical protein
MEDLIMAILQGCFEFLLEIFSYGPVDWIIPDEWPRSLAGKCFMWFIVGSGLALISMLFLNRTWITHPALRIANLALAPLISAFLSQAIARRRAKRDESIVPRNHFWQAFWFTVGIVTVRFAYAVRH